MRSLPLALVLLAVLAAGDARAEEPPHEAVPFPTAKTGKVRAKDGPIFYIDGPTVIPKNVEITVQLDVTIVGINDASLEVQGGLKVHGTVDHWVAIRNVDFSPTRAPKKGFHLDMVNLENCKFVHAEGPAFVGQMTIENGTMQRDCAFDFRIGEGFLRLMTVESGIGWKIRCEPADPKTDKIMVDVRSCWAREIRFSGWGEGTFRHSEIKNGLFCEHVKRLTVDGCDIYEQLHVKQDVGQVFKKVVLTKCNLFDGALLTLDRPPDADAKRDLVKVDKFFFGTKGGAPDLTKDAIAARIQDAEDVPERKVFAKVAGTKKGRHHLVDTTTLRLRVPPLK